MTVCQILRCASPVHSLSPRGEYRVSDGLREEANSVWDRLRRRKVVQWGIAYGAGAWGLLQGVAYMRDTFG